MYAFSRAISLGDHLAVRVETIRDSCNSSLQLCETKPSAWRAVAKFTFLKITKRSHCENPNRKALLSKRRSNAAQHGILRNEPIPPNEANDNQKDPNGTKIGAITAIADGYDGETQREGGS
jgi:hypothetical protein